MNGPHPDPLTDMLKKPHELDGRFEPEAKTVSTCISDAALTSIAVSLKRIADAFAGGENSQSSIRRRVLMRFTRTDVHDATLNKRSGERVVIEDVSSSDLPVIYASEMAEQEIRQHIRDGDENAYKRGFVVDVSVQTAGPKVIAYSVITLHSVVDID